MLRYRLRYLFVLSIIFLFPAFDVVRAETLKSILKYTLVHDPVLLEARADEEGAHNRVEQAKSLHWPKLRVTADSRLLENHKNSNDYESSEITPALELSMNIYSFGAIDAEIEKNQYAKEYFQHKYDESREELGYTVGDLYITALNAKQSIRALKQSLKRYDEILGDLDVIVTNDQGRQSEYVQAQARQILVKQQINDYQRLMETSLNSLSKYTRRFISEKDLKEPFQGMTRERLKKNYTLKDKNESPSFLAQQAELRSKIKDVDAQRAKRLPSINLVGTATPDDKQVGLNVSWDIFDRSTQYSIQEKASLQTAAARRLERIVRDIEEAARLALIDMQRHEIQLKTLKKQVKATTKVVDFYILQFGIARRSLIELLNAEKELLDVELAQTNTKNEWNRAVLEYLRSQGKISDWSGLIEK